MPDIHQCLSGTAKLLMDRTRTLTRTKDWWAHQDSNLEPRDSRDPIVSDRCGLSLHPQLALVGCGTL